MIPRHGSDEHGDWDALATAYALSALEPDEEARFVSHLATCARCTETVREATRTVADLAYAVPDEEPPPGLKQRLMAAVALAPRDAVPPPRAVAAEPTSPTGPGVPPAPAAPGVPPAPAGPTAPGVPSAPSGPTGPGVPTAPAAPTAPAGPTGPAGPAARAAAAAPGDGAAEPAEPAVTPFRRRTRRWQAVAAVAAVLVALAGLAGWNIKLRADEHRLRDTVAQQQAPARVVALASNGTRLATLVVRPGVIDVISEAMPPNPAGTTYWLWALNGLTDPHPVPIGGFEVRSPGPGVQTVRSSQAGVDQAKDFAVSVEPGGGTPTTPTTVVAAGAAVG